MQYQSVTNVMITVSECTLSILPEKKAHKSQSKSKKTVLLPLLCDKYHASLQCMLVNAAKKTQSSSFASFALSPEL